MPETKMIMKKKKNNIYNYDSLVRLRKKLKKHVEKQEKELLPELGFIDTLLGYAGVGGENSGNSAGIPVTEYLFPIISRAFTGVAVKFAKNERSKKIATGVVTVSAFALTVYLSRRINRFIDKLASGK